MYFYLQCNGVHDCIQQKFGRIARAVILAISDDHKCISVTLPLLDNCRSLFDPLHFDHRLHMGLELTEIGSFADMAYSKGRRIPGVGIVVDAAQEKGRASCYIEHWR